MKKLIIGTKNPSKLKQIQDALKSLKIEVVGLEDYQIDFEVKETGKTAQENARQKATTYSKVLKKPVLSMDNALFLNGLPDNQQPGIHVRRIKGRSGRPNDQEMLGYYSKLIKKLGGKINGHWEFATCVANGPDSIWETTFNSPRVFIAKPSNKVCPGYPLDSLQIDPESGKYISEMLMEEKNVQLWEKIIGGPLCSFVKKVFSQIS